MTNKKETNDNEQPLIQEFIEKQQIFDNDNDDDNYTPDNPLDNTGSEHPDNSERPEDSPFYDYDDEEDS